MCTYLLPLFSNNDNNLNISAELQNNNLQVIEMLHIEKIDYKNEQLGDDLPNENQIIEYKKLSIDIPEENPLIQKYRKEYTSNFGKQWLANVMNNAEPYRLFIREELEKRSMPAFLEYLPAVESSFNIRAVSKSKATGLWQFMENSIKPYMQKNSWVDERLDPWISTDAALKKLQENFNILGNWELALAAYNFGLGGISRLVKQYPGKNYWQLAAKDKLKTETKNYVPRLLVIADLVTNADFYGIDLPTLTEKDEHRFEEIIVNGAYDLNDIAQKANISIKELEFFNPALFYGVTPPTTNYKLRFPQNYAEQITEILKHIDPRAPKFHTVIKGETLWGISRQYNIDIDELCIINKINKNNILSIGTVLKLPIYK
ncbi:MAG: transglycosylase SLT domain-containing protein [Treponema sp.]|nr:transglycosylase SLT domain-containing protein [Treponema sp.]